MKKLIFILITILPLLGMGQSSPQLQQANHTFTLNKDSLTVFQEAEFFSIVPWYIKTDTTNFYTNTISLDIYYNPEIHAGAMEFTSYARDTFAIDNISIGNHILVVNSYEWGDSLDKNFNYYEFYTLRDSDTSYFQVLSDHSIAFTESPVSFYPNPAKDKITLQGLKPEDGEVEIAILSLKGKTVLETTVSHAKPEVDLTALPKGSYILKTPHTSSQIFLIQ